MGTQTNSWGGQEKLESLAISNQYKKMLNNFINSLNNSSDIKLSAMLRGIVMSISNIPNLGDNASGLKEDGNFLDDKSPGQQQRSS